MFPHAPGRRVEGCARASIVLINEPVPLCRDNLEWLGRLRSVTSPSALSLSAPHLALCHIHSLTPSPCTPLHPLPYPSTVGTHRDRAKTLRNSPLSGFSFYARVACPRTGPVSGG
ncbi:unnamed protein product [Protopolystoma xenopodis]|uniref:Uncharacterized protein n=1 Tax=Protopolystoma xenopodis TaxID=117903 RepID=A0A3S5FG38_9PLAT|nr:unnamed protein product [Protopolystoma xenopodis]